MALTIDAAQLHAHIAELAQLGVDGSGGRTRVAFTAADQAGRDLLCSWMRALDLTVQVDAIGNIFGILPGRDAHLPPLMIGSHIDTVIHAGAYDGCYGVLAGLAVVRAWRAAGVTPTRGLVIAAFSNEEGVRYQPDMMGSLVHAGGLDVEDALDTRDDDGVRLADALAQIGYAGPLPVGSIRPAAFVELHIEQGPILELEHDDIGAVTHVQGISWQRLTVQGHANHAGTTPMPLRHDAGMALMHVLTALHAQVVAAPQARLTVGTMAFAPGAINVIPQQATCTVDLRDPDEQVLQQLEQALIAECRAAEQRFGVRITAERLARFAPVPFDAALVDQIATAATRRGHRVRRMVSGAGHDAQMMARVAPAAMIFVPSRGGISHHPDEYTDPAQLVAGAEVLLDVASAFCGA
jgi:N-carbamoyl-L-amino-acid hydrolase